MEHRDVDAYRTSLSIVVLTFRRDDALLDTLERISSALGTSGFQLVLVDNNADGKNRRTMIDRFEDAVLVDERYNMGVAAGRNKGISVATGDVLLFLDDDALLEVPADFTTRLTDLFDHDPKLGVVAFRSFVGAQRIEDPIEFPHTDKSKDHDSRFDTFRFIGVAHAIRRSLLNQTGLYCASFFYGMEEFDLSYRALKLGYRIEFRPEFRVQHMKANAGRLPSSAVIRRMYANKLSVGWMHLPARLFLASGAAWFLKTLLDSKNPAVPFRAIGDFLAMVSHGQLQKRDPSSDLVAEIRRLGGKAWR
ncbi:glycosyltransferase family 2 protein [Rhizobium sp. BK176]|uniref:glycosyltransferase family 2 protein n=1 Tax=Rhizobium sp. BK176 TaxID=2587071 RepID=UPI002168397C|nr:glycosyltransferase [Rhizobium sp. BK176]MCS4089993.1 GT2 family glycosyltransferase [Rhizobium sp. BK176]